MGRSGDILKLNSLAVLSQAYDAKVPEKAIRGSQLPTVVWQHKKRTLPSTMKILVSPTSTHLILPILLIIIGAFLAVAIVAFRHRLLKEIAGNDHTLVFPPSRRHVLSNMQRRGKKSPTLPQISLETLKAKALPTTRLVDLNHDIWYTPTGFSTKEIKALGHFPDYAQLSGVPHPQPCSGEFDIHRASFRPFRPFRWGYHQTMCQPCHRYDEELDTDQI
jgi:hypothetical protein